MSNLSPILMNATSGQDSVEDRQALGETQCEVGAKVPSLTVESDKARVNESNSKPVSIIDIRKPDFQNFDLKPLILSGIQKPFGEKQIPTLVLYDDKGLQLFDEITYQPEYYLTEAEIDILKNESITLVEHIPDGSVVVELGAGSLRKTKVLLDALNETRKEIKYYALDVMEKELIKSLEKMGSYENVECHGLWGTYDDGLDYLKTIPENVHKSVLWLGSSIGNLDRSEASEFVCKVRDCLNPGDNFMIGIDLRNSSERVAEAYDDPKGVTKDFILNGLVSCNHILGQQVFEMDKFEYLSIVDQDKGFHESRYLSKVDQKLTFKTLNSDETIEVKLKKDEEINVEFSYKYSYAEINELIHQTRFNVIDQLVDSTKSYSFNVLIKPPFHFGGVDKKFSTPQLKEWVELFKAWDYVINTLVTSDMLLDKPISLRHPFIFYLGHIPAFLDIQLANHFKSKLTEPKQFATWFERGIDPDCEDPSKCHPHSEVPDNWPSKSEIVEYQNKVKERLYRILETEELTKRLGRVLSYVFEHQAMHLETLLYMLARVPKIGTIHKHVKFYKKRNGTLPVPKAKLITIEAGEVQLGHDDIESEDKTELLESHTTFGWDNESPSHTTLVQTFQVQPRPVTNYEYLEFLKDTVNKNHPSLWVPNGNFEFRVKTFLGEVDMDIAGNWPVSCSNDQAKAYAEWSGLRLPTESELLRCHSLLSSNSEPLHPIRPTNLNIGFLAWHPIPVSPTEFQLFGDGWEHTSTPFQPHPQFQPSKLYPGYSKDFFDGKHNVMLGGSYVTHPRLSERKTFRNWYQKSYPFMFASFRCAL